MKRYYFAIIAVLVSVLSMPLQAATIENEYFAISTLDDSWFLVNDDALRPYGARVDVSRSDARGATLELARIDYIEGAFSPKMYLTKQVVEKKDKFCRSANSFTEFYDSYLAGFEAQGILFKKTSNGYTYDCEAVAFNAGFGTFFVIMAHRTGEPSLIRRLVDGMKCKVDTAAVTTSSQYVNLAQAVVKRHHLPIGNNEHLSAVEMSPDSSTVTMTVTVPYISKENVNVPSFVMVKRDAWFKQAPEALKFNMLLAALVRERKNLRYFYVDTKGNEIGTLMIMPEEYEQVERIEAERKQQELQRAQEEEAHAKAEAARAQEEARQRALQEKEKKAAEAATVIHEVKSGDNLTKIANRYGVSVSAIKNDNPGIKNDQIQIGQKLVIKKN